MHSCIHIVCRDKTCGVFFLWYLSRWNEKDNIFSHTGWQESALHTLWHPEGRTMHLWQHASVQQNDAIPNLLPSWCKLGAGWRCATSNEKTNQLTHAWFIPPLFFCSSLLSLRPLSALHRAPLRWCLKQHLSSVSEPGFGWRAAETGLQMSVFLMTSFQSS